MKDLKDTKEALNAIRSALDSDVVDCDIESVKGKMLALTQLIGLSAEAMASCKKILHNKEIEVFVMMEEKKMAPSIQAKFLNAHCKDEIAMMTYSDRLNSAIIHSIDALRTAISLYKTELENTLKAA